MPAIVPGYEYDIFISYRQNDNKPATAGERDGWVSGFVNALRDELEATLKNPVSIYFDENPHDGLLEMHQVGASLEKKLKCLVFIPIISQTYCDPSGFAWAQEFLPFNSMAKADELGMQLTLANGNVVSRILPLKIHDLDDVDQQLLDQELGGPMRSIDFIYKEPGVNRPLKPSDSKSDNLNKTSYHNQLNKVANTLKEMGQAILNQDQIAEKPAPLPVSEPSHEAARSTKNRNWFIAAAVVILAIIGYFISQGTSSSEVDYDYDIAVMYFENLTDDDKYDDGLVNLIQINLEEDTSLNLVPRQQLYDALKEISDIKTPDQSVATELAASLNVEFMVIGRVIQQGLEVLTQVELIEVKTGKVVARKKITQAKEEIFTLADNITSQLMQGRIPERNYDVTNLTTANYTAYQYFYEGMEAIWDVSPRLASQYFSKAIALDSTFAMAIVYKALSDNFFVAADIYINAAEGKSELEKAQPYISKLPLKDQLFAKLVKETINNDPEYYTTLKKLNKSYPNDAFLSEFNAWVAMEVYYDPNAVTQMEAIIARYPERVERYNMMAYLYVEYNEPEKAVEAVTKYLAGEPDVFNAYHSSWEVNLMAGKPDQAIFFAKQMEEKFTLDSRFTWRGLSYLFALQPDSLLSLYGQHLKEVVIRSPIGLGKLGYMMKGQWSKALVEINRTTQLAQDSSQQELAIILKMGQPIVLMAQGKTAKAISTLDAIIDDVADRYTFNPHLVLAHYYKGLVYLEGGDISMAESQALELDLVISQGNYDSRFKKFSELLAMEIALKKGDLDKLARMIDASNIKNGTSGRYFTIYLQYLIEAGQYEAALAYVDNIHRHLLSVRTTFGGDENLFVLSLIHSNYYRGVIYEKLGNKPAAIKAYRQFLELLKEAESEIPAMGDARKRLAALGQTGEA